MIDPQTYLTDIFQQLPQAEQLNLIAFAEFLRSRSGSVPRRVPAPPPEPVVIPEPEQIPRPQQESVVKAVKRLSQTYPMLDKSAMLDDTSTLVMQHVIQGRDAAEVIDELEIVFERYYTQLKDKHQ